MRTLALWLFFRPRSSEVSGLCPDQAFCSTAGIGGGATKHILSRRWGRISRPSVVIVRGAGVALLPGVLLNGHHRWRFNKTYPALTVTPSDNIMPLSSSP